VIATANALQVDVLTAGDWPAVSAIFAEGIATRNATFETTVPSWDEWACAHMGHHRLVGRVDDEVVGWAALSRASTRQCYRGVAEDSVYIRRGYRGQGVGHALLSTLVAQAEAAGIWTVQAGVFPENLASLRLHVACGFRVVGVRERIGQLDGAWRDVVFLERRSKEIA
jgi:L-amino acid N-acyltransferase YncA